MTKRSKTTAVLRAVLRKLPFSGPDRCQDFAPIGTASAGRWRIRRRLAEVISGEGPDGEADFFKLRDFFVGDGTIEAPVVMD